MSAVTPRPARLLLALALALLAVAPAPAAEGQTLVATRAIRGTTLIGPADVALVPGTVPGALSDPALAVGREARVTLYPGRPIRPGELSAPATVARNATVTLRYATGALLILAEGRALERGGPGDRVRVMNVDTKVIVTGRIGADGIVEVTP